MTRFFLTILFAGVFVSGQAQRQNDSIFEDFLSSLSTVECLERLDSIQINDLFGAQKIYVENHTVSMNAIAKNTVKINVAEFCTAYNTISIHYYKSLAGEYFFVYRKFAELREDYGALQLYQKKNEKWELGQRLKFDWQHFFNISEKEVQRLRESKQSPKYLVEFKPQGIQFDIPWELYSFGEGSEINAFVQSNGEQPIILPYAAVIK